MNKGVKRLAILLGSIPALAWWVFIAVDSFRHGPPLFQWEWRIWMIIIGITAVSFLIPFGLVHAIAWVIRGFKK